MMNERNTTYENKNEENLPFAIQHSAVKKGDSVSLPKGYKQTEVGVIPEDWLDINLGGSSILKARIGWQGLTTAEYLKSGDYYLITGTDFLNGFIDWDNCVYVEKERYVQDKNIQIVPEDILVTKDGTIGKVAFIDKVTLPTTLNSGVFVIRPKRGDYHPRYLYHILMSEHFKDFLGKLTAGSTISHLYQKDFVNYEFPAPPTLTEQKAIATALSDVDALLSSLERLITKKKAIKQGAMQELLTPPQKGGKRLPGFSGEWEERTLGEITELITKGTTPTSIGKEFTNQGIRFIKAESIDKTGNIINDKVAFIDAETHELLGRSKMKKDDILFTIAGVLGRIGVMKEDNLPANTNQAVAIVRLKKSLNLFVPFFFHILRTNAIAKHIESISVQGAQANFSLNDVSNIPLCIPVSSEEQKSIAQILSDMDLEIEALEAKKEKYKGIKQGMMQELLTGKIRLV